ncbi:MAG: alpha/beta hydrolase [Hyphomicrobiaceae bacterium]|nr:alpha/beta hydrolase [Hyphomicrobiaceae bacterium]
MRKDLTSLASFVTAPFPFEGIVPATGKMFLDVEEGTRRGHRGSRGQIYWADETYDDSRVLLHLPKGFNAQKPGMIVVFFHGHGATLERDVLRRQQVAAQISRAGLNAALVAPQFARDAADSSAGKFWQPGSFFWFMEEAAQQLAQLYGDPHAVRYFERMPIVFVAYSGGYLPAAFAIQNGGTAKRVRAVLLLDALYGDLDKYMSWILRHRSGVFVSAYTHHTAERNADLQKVLKDRNILFETAIRKPLLPGTLAFVETGPEILHRDYVTEAWAAEPVLDFLKALTVKP